jgi:hypothetical protein
MKKLIFVITLIITFVIINANAEIAVWRKGGFKSLVSQGQNQPMKLECGNDDSKNCAKFNNEGKIIEIGDPVKIWINTNNEPVGSEVTGIGYINAIFIGYENPSDPTSDILFSITPQTLIFYSYQEWVNNVNP